jgi:hypothetical protein
MRGVVWLVGLVVLVSGCAGSSTGVRLDPRPSAAFDGSTGGIEGLVVDPEYRPIEGAHVVLIGTNLTANTSAEGRFAMSNLVPQQYLGIITKAGFKESRQGFEVPLGNVTRQRVVLEPIPPPVPYVDVATSYSGTIQNGYAVRAGTVGTNSSGTRSNPSTNLRPMGHWQSVLLEVNWKPASDQSDQLALQVTWAEKADNGGTSLVNKEWVAGGDPPLRWRLDRAQLEQMREKNPKLLANLSYGLPFSVGTSTDASGAADVGVYPEQSYTVLVSIGYYGPIPANHTRLPPP